VVTEVAPAGPFWEAEPERQDYLEKYPDGYTINGLMNALGPDQQDKLREMQRSWIHTRDLTCAFWYDYFQGTMANPMIAYCNNRETARRAIFLRIFAADIADRSGNSRPEQERVRCHRRFNRLP
jgi:hypothetical protein